MTSIPCPKGHTERYENGNCKQCTRDARKRYRQAHPERVTAQRERWKKTQGGEASVRNSQRRRKMTDVPEVEAQPGHPCEICQRPITGHQPQADHNHTTGKFRGWLCRQCNSGLAAVERSGFVEAARAYLESKS